MILNRYNLNILPKGHLEFVALNHTITVYHLSLKQYRSPMSSRANCSAKAKTNRKAEVEEARSLIKRITVDRKTVLLRRNEISS